MPDLVGIKTSKNDLEALEFRVAQIGSLRRAGLRMRFAKVLGIRPVLKMFAGVPNGVRSIKRGGFIRRAFQ